ncbi:hypothetical protein FRC06_007744, partial [Ceratobasidium sp. 370]
YIERNPAVNRYKLCTGISEGVAYLHQNGTIHGDIKSANVLISSNGVAKLADFGCTELKTGSLYFTTTTSESKFSMRWAAPEILVGPVTRSKEADVYALGMTILEAVTGVPPFSDKHNMAVYVTVVGKKQIPERPNEFPSFESNEADRLWQIMVGSWAYNPSDRPGSAIIRDGLKGIKQRATPISHSTVSRTVGPGKPPLSATVSSKVHDGEMSRKNELSLLLKVSETSMVFFIAFPHVYVFDKHRIVCCIDHANRCLEVGSLQPNPPNPETMFYLENIPYWFDRHNQLWYNLDGQWYPETTYSDLPSVRVELARCAER